MELITKYAIEIIFGLVSAGALAFCKHLWSKNKKLEEMQKEDQNRKYRQMIVDEIEPIIAEITRIKGELASIVSQGKSEIDGIKHLSEEEHTQMYKDLKETHDETLKALELITNSYKFRLIQLCKTHLRDGYITEPDFEQITEMYKLYNGLGGNGQAQEYYDKVKALEIREEND